MENRAAIVSNIQYECRYIHGRTRLVEVEHFYQMVWYDDRLTFLWLSKDQFNDRYVKEQVLGWRYAVGIGFDDIVLNAQQIRKIEVYSPEPYKIAQSILIEVEECKDGKYRCASMSFISDLILPHMSLSQSGNFRISRRSNWWKSLSRRMLEEPAKACCWEWSDCGFSLF